MPGTIDPRGMRARLRWGVVATTVAALLMGPASVPAAQAQPDPVRPVVTGWLPSWDMATAVRAVEANADLMSEASPFWFTARASGGRVSISSAASTSAMDAVVEDLRGAGVTVIPSVVDGSAARAMATVLKSASGRRAHVAQLVSLVTARGFDGIELDYEKFAFSDGRATWATTRPAWVSFVKELGSALHARGKLLALAVPVMYDGDRDSSSGYWVYDYAGVSGAVDSLRIMTYDYSVSRPGPISPLSFVRRTLSYAVTAFPRARIHMGLPAYGRLWVARRADGTQSISGTCPTSGVPGTTSFTATKARSYLTTMAGGTTPTIRHDATTGESVATFRRSYTGTGSKGRSTTCTVDHVAWWVDAAGVAQRMELVGSHRIAGAAVWHLSGMAVDGWSAIRAYAQSVAPEPTTVTVTAPATLVSGGSATVRVAASSAASVPAGATVRLYRRTVGTSTWRKVATARTGATGRATLKVASLARSTQWRATVSGAWDRLAGSGRASTAVAAKVRASVSTTRPAPGTKVKVGVRVVPRKKGMVVRRQMLVGRTWRTMATARTTATGRATFTFTWPKGQPRSTYRITTRATSTLLAGATPRFTIATR